ncbi:hypothetical protein CSPX01_01782 [Colletotrichum filicis]|nr:hypothetical protein CSPX01_01782 [Colletotrichum filicis]
MHRYDTLIHRRLTGTFRLAARVRAGNQNHSEWSTWTSERGKRIRLPRICRCLAVLSPGSGLVRWNRFIECDGCLHLLFSCLFPAAFCLTSPTSSTSPRYHTPPFQSISLEPVRYRTGIGKVRDGSEAGRQRCAKGDSGSSESYLWLGISKSVSVVFFAWYLHSRCMGKAEDVPSLAAWFVCPPPERELPLPASVGSTAHGTMKRRVQPDPGKSSTPRPQTALLLCS